MDENTVGSHVCWWSAPDLIISMKTQALGCGKRSPQISTRALSSISTPIFYWHHWDYIYTYICIYNANETLIHCLFDWYFCCSLYQMLHGGQITISVCIENSSRQRHLIQINWAHIWKKVFYSRHGWLHC